MTLETGIAEVILKKIQRDQNISKILSAEVEDAVNEGDNYTSEMKRVKMKVVLQSGKIREKSVIMKKRSGSEFLQMMLTECKVYQNELYIYKEVLPAMEELMVSKKGYSDNLWCQCLGNDDTTMVLEDLKEFNFQMFERMNGLDEKHTILTVKSLGKFHALSCILQKNNLMDFKTMSPYLFTKKIELINRFFQGALQSLFEAIKTIWGHEWIDVAEKLEAAMNNFSDKLEKLAEDSEKSFKVLNHGDIWINNILFKYSSLTNDPQELRFVDFQAPHYNSFAWDLIYLFHSSLIPEFRRNNYDKFMFEYRDSLKSTLLEYDWPEEEIPSVESLKEEMKRLEFFGLLLNCTNLPSTLSHPSDRMEVYNLMVDGKTKVLNMYARETYREAMKKELLYLIENNLL